MIVHDPQIGVGARTYRFDHFELDVTAHRLTSNGEPIHMERRPFDLLVLLVMRHGQLLTREEIVSTLWPGNVIIDFEAGLNTLVRKVRLALSDSSDAPAFVETVAGRGYRFVAPVVEITQLESPPAPDLPGGTVLKPWQRLTTALVALAAAAGLIFGGWQAANREPEATSIAVLPFQNLSGNTELGYLASGLAEEISASLTRIDPARLRVIGGVSATTLAGSSLPMAQIGGEFGLEYVVRSSLQVDRSRIRVNTSLIRVADNEQIWSATFDRELSSTLALQRELSIAIAEQIRLRLSSDVSAEIDRRQTQNPEAYGLYLKGRYAWGQFTPASNRDALRYYERAVLTDPNYALAWAGIAQALAVSLMTTDADPEAVATASRYAIQQAIRSGPNLAEVMYAKGYVKLFLDWNAPAAEVAARQAVTLDPNNALSHMFLGVVLSQIDNHVEARTMMRRARELDPLFAQTFALSSMVANQAGDYRSGLEFAKQAIAISPEAWVGYLHLGTANLALGDYDAALKAFSDAERFSGGNSGAVAARASVLARMGHTDDARDAAAQLQAKAVHRYVPPYEIAGIYASLGEIDKSFEWLERALSVHDAHLLGLEKDLTLEALRSDPRYSSLLMRRAALIE